MSVKTYSLKNDGNKNISKSFKVREFACRDGSEKILIDSDNVQQLQLIRDYFDKPVKINSGYRTAAYNKKIGGAKNSYHVQGMAADIVISGVQSVKVAMRASLLGCRCVLWYPLKNFTHIDSRGSRFGAIYFDNGKYYPEPASTLRAGAKGNDVKWIQYMLNQIGYKLAVDGVYGPALTLAVKDFQRKCELTVDGVFGAKTLTKLKEVLTE